MSARTILWAGGVTASPLGRTLAERTSAVTDRTGKIKVTPRLNLPHHPDIFIVGDLALFIDSDGKALPGVAQVAMQQGTYAAKAIVKSMRGETELPAFRYVDKGSLAVIGRWSAVANIFSLHMSGLFAWLVWACVHLMYLVQFQSRVLVFIHWAFQDLTFSRGARLITQSAVSEVHFDEEVASSEKSQQDMKTRTASKS
jgi:NADH dehydrogenase